MQNMVKISICEYYSVSDSRRYACGSHTICDRELVNTQECRLFQGEASSVRIEKSRWLPLAYRMALSCILGASLVRNTQLDTAWQISPVIDNS